MSLLVTKVLDSSFSFSLFFFSLLNSSISSSVSGPGIQSNGEYHRTKSSSKQPGFAALKRNESAYWNKNRRDFSVADPHSIVRRGEGEGGRGGGGRK